MHTSHTYGADESSLEISLNVNSDNEAFINGKNLAALGKFVTSIKPAISHPVTMPTPQVFLTQLLNTCNKPAIIK